MHRPPTHNERLIAAGLKRPRQRRPDTRPGPRQRGYSAEWDRYAKSVLRRQPWCERCGRPGAIVDHITPIAAGGPVWGPVQVLCRCCHACKTHADRAKYPHAYPPPKGAPTPTATRFLTPPVGTVASSVGAPSAR